MLNIVRGDFKNKPVASSRLGDFFEARKDQYEGTLYLGYPIIGTASGGFKIDALLITKEKGLILFHIEEGAEFSSSYKEIQDESYIKLHSKLSLNNQLVSKRSLAIDINVASYTPAVAHIAAPDDEYPCLRNDEELDEYLEKIPNSTGKYYEKVQSVLQSITTIRKNKSRDYVQKENSRGAKLRNLEDSIANLDRQQSSAVIETVDGVQRIRGLAGSGKTIILALKVAYLHATNPEWRIAVTFNTRSLKDQFKRFIRMFTYEHINEEPNWDRVEVIHAWGTNSSDGIYFNLCSEHNVPYLDFKSAKAISPSYGSEFDTVCEKALNEITEFNEKYDVIVIDEAQDFSKHFLQICYRILKNPKRLIYAYDELQSLNQKSMASPEIIFGTDKYDQPLVQLKNEDGKPKQDIVLYKCYRNSLQLLTTAHSLGFGIYRKDGLVQMFDSKEIWEEIGYVSDKSINEGEEVTLYRTTETSPDFLSNHSSIDDLIHFNKFDNNQEQIDYVVSEIVKNIEEDELTLEDIIVINPDPLTTKDVVGAFRRALFDKGINSDLAGVSTSPDIFYTGETITFTGIYRAKGNEAAMVYIINSEYCSSGYELSKKRNILFTAMTRSKAWVRVLGCGYGMQQLIDEYNQVKENNFQLKFIYPTRTEREHMNIVNRDMSVEEKSKRKKNEQNLHDLLRDLKDGKIKKEDIPSDMLEGLRTLLDL